MATSRATTAKGLSEYSRQRRAQRDAQMKRLRLQLVEDLASAKADCLADIEAFRKKEDCKPAKSAAPRRRAAPPPPAPKGRRGARSSRSEVLDQPEDLGTAVTREIAAMSSRIKRRTVYVPDLLDALAKQGFGEHEVRSWLEEHSGREVYPTMGEKTAKPAAEVARWMRISGEPHAYVGLV